MPANQYEDYYCKNQQPKEKRGVKRTYDEMVGVLKKPGDKRTYDEMMGVYHVIQHRYNRY